MSDLFAGLKPDDYDRVYRNRELVGRIGRHLAGERWSIAGAALLIVGSSLLMAAVPIVIAGLIDDIGMRGARGVGHLVSGFVVVAAVLAWGMNWLRQVLTSRLVGAMVHRLQREAASAVLAKEAAFFDRNSVGQILSRVTGDTEGFSSVMTLTLNFLSQVFLVFLLGTLVFLIDVRLGLVVLATVPVLVVTALAFRRIARVAAQNTRRVMARVNANVHESMAGIAVAKSFGQEEKLYASFDEVNRQSYRLYLRQGLIYSVIMPILALLSGLAGALVLYSGGLLAARGELSAGEWYFALHALGMLWLPLTQAASFWSLFQQGLAASERVFALVDSRDQITQRDCKPVPRLRGSIELRKVCFAYGRDEPVFQGLDLRMGPSETVAVVGHTGAGKSSLAKLIARSYEFQDGQVLVDGRDLRTLDLVAYRRQLGIVPQHPFLFAGSVAENIAYAKPGATREAVERAIDRIGLDLWKRSMVLSLDDPLPVGGRGMSVGQRQLIALARVFVKDSAIVILDEPTASIDPLTEASLQNALSRLFEGRTVLVIAHRLSTIRKAHRIVVLANGQVEEQGSYGELLALGGHFAQLHATYYAHQRLDEV